VLDRYVRAVRWTIYELFHNLYRLKLLSQRDFPDVGLYDNKVGMKENAGRARRLLEEGYERAGARIARAKESYDSEDAYLEDRPVAETIVHAWFRARSCRGVRIGEPRNRKVMQTFLLAVGLSRAGRALRAILLQPATSPLPSFRALLQSRCFFTLRLAIRGEEEHSAGLATDRRREVSYCCFTTTTTTTTTTAAARRRRTGGSSASSSEDSLS